MLRTSLKQDRPFGSINNKQHYKTAYKIASEGIVLLKNNDNFLPIDKTKRITIAVIGENAEKSMSIGGGSSELKPDKEISPLLGIQKEFSNAVIKYARGYSSDASKNNDKLIKEALSIVKDADVVLFIGGLNKNRHQDSEAADRESYLLPYNQPELIKEISKINKNIAVILVSGNAVETSWKTDVKSILQSWYLGSEAGNAIASILSGKINPSGKLPFSFPKALNDNGAHHFGKSSYPGDGTSQFYEEDILVGYRWHDTKKIDPSFSFGYGLSYTSFELLESSLDKKKYLTNETIRVNCSVKNTGKQDGKEVVQVYVGKVNSKIDRAKKELKGFKKVFVKNNQSEQIKIDIPISSLAFYNETDSDWEIEKGGYVIYIGNASDNIWEEISITII
jgi:beta-glucosidase